MMPFIGMSFAAWKAGRTEAGVGVPVWAFMTSEKAWTASHSATEMVVMVSALAPFMLAVSWAIGCARPGKSLTSSIPGSHQTQRTFLENWSNYFIWLSEKARPAVTSIFGEI